MHGYAQIKELKLHDCAEEPRLEPLYEGPMDDEAANAIRAGDQAGPSMMYVSKLVAASDTGRFHVFACVFSRTTDIGQRLRIHGPHHKLGSKED